MKLTSKNAEQNWKGEIIPASPESVSWEKSISSDVRIKEHFKEYEEEESYESTIYDKHAFVTEWTVLGKSSIQKTFNYGSKDEFIVEW
ncbi:MAG: hypothetical protein LUG51_11865 [Tannerellaceae bacterium]|nr:hypothetical protein [Tannerellaceae bacterium]